MTTENPAAPDGDPDRVARTVEQWRRTAPSLDVSPLEVFGRMHRTYVHYNARISRHFGEHDLSPAGFEVIAALYRHGEPYRMSVTQLAGETLISAGGMTMRLDRLERDGYVVRDRTSPDRRLVLVSLTPVGLERVVEVATEHFANEAAMLTCLDEDERRVLAGLLATLERHLR